MDITEIVLLIAGGIIFILSFLIPEKKGEVSEQSKDLVKEEIADMVSREMESIRGRVDDVVEEAVTYAMEKTERSLERLSNEKIMAVNEYSDTVLSEIHKNHEEAMFLYDMLNSKHTNLKNTVSEVNRTVKEAEEKVSSFQNLTNISAFHAEATAGGAVSAGGIPLGEPPVGSQGRTVSGVVSNGMGTMTEPAPITAIERLSRAASSRTSGESAAVTASPRISGPASSAAVTASPRTSGPASSAAVTASPRTSGPASSAAVTASPRTSGPAPAAVLPRSPETAARGRDAVPSAAGSVSFLQENDADGRNEKDRILELYNHGKSKVAIAKELGLGVGEVKLVIDLFKNQ